MDVEKQIAYWRDGARESFRSVPHLEEGEFWTEALFWTHLAVEKALKAHVAKVTREAPPYIHKLTRLMEIAKLELSPENVQLCEDLSLYQRLARYPHEKVKEPDAETAKTLIRNAVELMEWLLKRL